MEHTLPQPTLCFSIFPTPLVCFFFCCCVRLRMPPMSTSQGSSGVTYSHGTIAYQPSSSYTSTYPRLYLSSLVSTFLASQPTPCHIYPHLCLPFYVPLPRYLAENFAEITSVEAFESKKKTISQVCSRHSSFIVGSSINHQPRQRFFVFMNHHNLTKPIMTINRNLVFLIFTRVNLVLTLRCFDV